MNDKAGGVEEGAVIIALPPRDSTLPDLFEELITGKRSRQVVSSTGRPFARGRIPCPKIDNNKAYNYRNLGVALTLNMNERAHPSFVNIRIIAPKTDPDVRRLYRRFKSMGRCPVASNGVILYLVNDAVENEKGYVLSLVTKK